MTPRSTPQWRQCPPSRSLRLAAARHARRLIAGQGGLLLQSVIILLTLGSLIVIPWLAFVADSVDESGKAMAADEEYYAADAGIQAVLKDMALGQDPLAQGYAIPTVQVNGLTVALTIAAAPVTASLLSTPLLADPDTTTNFLTLGPNASYQYVLPNVEANTPININWVFSLSGSWRIRVYANATGSGTPFVNVTGNSSPAQVTVSSQSIADGPYTIRFTNTHSTRTVTTAPFSNTANAASTWIKANALKSYLITATAGGTTQTVLARVAPGPSSSRRAVQVSSWEGGG